MARIRTVKPEFYSDEKLAAMRPIDRLVFLGLLSMADDAGRVIDNVKAIDGFMFSETEDSCAESLMRLAGNGRIVRYGSPSGQRLIQIAKWGKHQKIDKPGIHVLPAPPEGWESPSRLPRESAATVPRSDLVPSTYDLGARPGSSGPSTPPALHHAREEQEAFIARFPETHREDVRCLLVRVGERWESWMRSLEAKLTGLHPPIVPIEILAESIRQLNTNGGNNWRAFEGYVRRVMAGPPPDTTPNGNGQTAADPVADRLKAWADRKQQGAET